MRKIFIDYDAARKTLDKMCEDASKRTDVRYWLGLMDASIALDSLLGDKQTATFVDVKEGEA